MRENFLSEAFHLLAGWKLLLPSWTAVTIKRNNFFQRTSTTFSYAFHRRRERPPKQQHSLLSLYLCIAVAFLCIHSQTTYSLTFSWVNKFIQSRRRVPCKLRPYFYIITSTRVPVLKYVQHRGRNMPLDPRTFSMLAPISIEEIVADLFEC